MLMNRFRFVLPALACLVMLSACTYSAYQTVPVLPSQINLTPYANETYERPWPNRPSAGYTDWFNGNAWLHESIPFQMADEGGVLSLAPQEEAMINLNTPTPASQIHVLCAADLPMDELMTFQLSAHTSEGIFPVRLEAHSWQVPAEVHPRDRDYMVQDLPILLDDEEAHGQVGISSATIRGQVAQLQIKNTGQTDLMIAAITFE